MATLIRNFQASQSPAAGSSTASMYTSELSTGPTQQEIQQSLERNLVARETTRFYEEYFKTQQQVQLDAFATAVAKKMYSTSCDQTTAAATEIQATCTAFHAQAQALKVTASTLAQVRLRLDEQIAEQVEACGAGASCVLERHISRVDSELVVAQTKRDDVQTWLTTLQTLRTNAERDSNRFAANGSAGFGARYTAETMRSTVATPAGTTEEMLTDVRVNQVASEPFGEEGATPKTSRRHR